MVGVVIQTADRKVIVNRPTTTVVAMGGRGPAGGPGGEGPPGPPGTTAWADITDKPASFPPSAHNQAIDTITGLQGILDGKAAIESQDFTGTPMAPTPALGDTSRKIATMAALDAALTHLIGGAPANLDTLKEIADQLATDESNYAALVAVIATKLAKASNLGDLPDVPAARGNLGLGTAALAAASDFQAADADLAAIALLSTQTYGRAFLTYADAVAAKTALAIATGDVSGLSAALALLAPRASPSFTGSTLITSNSATALVVGPNGTANPVFQVDGSTASSANGLLIRGTTAGSGVLLQAISSAATENIEMKSKGSNSAIYFTGGAGQTTMGLAGNNLTMSAGSGSVSFNMLTNTASMGRSATGSNNSVPLLTLTEGTSTSLPAGSNCPTFQVNGAARNHATGALALQEEIKFVTGSHSFTGASTVTDLVGLSISGPPSGGASATVTNAHALMIPTKALTGVTNGYGLTVAAPSGATNNYATQFIGDTLLTGRLLMNGLAVLKGYTFATLPSSPLQGSQAFITDATAPALGSAVASGGSAFASIIYNGSAWTVTGK
jgi:hypothetical protein